MSEFREKKNNSAFDQGFTKKCSSCTFKIKYKAYRPSLFSHRLFNYSLHDNDYNNNNNND